MFHLKRREYKKKTHLKTRHVVHGYFLICNRDAFQHLFKILHRQAPGFQFWSASVYYKNLPPFMTKVVLTEPLRTPPTVSNAVQQSEWMRHGISRVYPYTDASSPLPSVGLPSRDLLHDDRPGHEVRHPQDCEECGREIARLLLDELQVGSTGRCVCV